MAPRRALATCGPQLSSQEPAQSSGVRPRVVAPRQHAANARFDLGPARPVVCRPPAAVEAAPVGPHEVPVHLQATPVRPAGVVPAALVTVDAEEAMNDGRMRRAG